MYPRSCEKLILKSIGRDWRKFKSSLKDAFFNPAIQKNPIIKRKALYKLCPEDVDNDQWRGLVKYWKSKKGRVMNEILYFPVFTFKCEFLGLSYKLHLRYDCIITGPH